LAVLCAISILRSIHNSQKKHIVGQVTIMSEVDRLAEKMKRKEKKGLKMDLTTFQQTQQEKEKVSRLSALDLCTLIIIHS
jgi:hypothetical protein